MTEEEKEKMKLDTVNIGDVEIFQTGVWKGQAYTEKDIDTMVENFNNGIAEPFITIDHSDKASGQFKDALQALSLGFVDKLERQGPKLKAWFKQVPKTIADLIQAGALKKKSIEFFRQFASNGKLYKNVLQGVTFHGANGLPEVNTLSDFLTLYKSNLQVMNVKDGIVSLDNSQFKQEEQRMSEEMIKMKDDQIAKLENQLSTFKSEIEDKDKEITVKDEVISDKDAEIATKDAEISKSNEEKETALKKEADEYISLKITDGILKPAHKDRYVTEYIQYKSDDKMFADFKEDIEGRDKVINLDPTKYSKKDKTTNFKYNPDELDFKAGASLNYVELEKEVQAVMTAENLSWEEAAVKCGLTSKQEIGKED